MRNEFDIVNYSYNSQIGSGRAEGQGTIFNEGAASGSSYQPGKSVNHTDGTGNGRSDLCGGRRASILWTLNLPNGSGYGIGLMWRNKYDAYWMD